MTLKFKRREFLLALGTAIAVSACQSPPHTKQAARSSSAPRIVALEWSFVESLLMLGIQPVGVADIQGYQEYVNIPLQLSETAQNVGTRQEPNLETIAQLQPDLILGVNFRHQSILPTLESIAPTQLFNAYPENINQLTHFQEMFLEIAKLTEKENQSKEYLQQFQAKITQVKQELSQQKLTQRPIVLAQFVPSPSPIRIFTQESLPSQILSAIGLQNAWKGKFSQFGFNRIGIEALTQVQEVNFLYVPPDEKPEIATEIMTNPLWEKLQFVQENRVYALAGDLWLYGSLVSAEMLMEQVRDQLLKT